MPNLKRGYPLLPVSLSETRHLARQVGGASADFFFINFEFIPEIFVRFLVEHATKKEA